MSRKTISPIVDRNFNFSLIRERNKVESISKTEITIASSKRKLVLFVYKTMREFLLVLGTP